MEPYYPRLVNKWRDKQECVTWEALAPTVRFLLKFPRWSLKQEKAETYFFVIHHFSLRKIIHVFKSQALRKVNQFQVLSDEVNACLCTLLYVVNKSTLYRKHHFRRKLAVKQML